MPVLGWSRRTPPVWAESEFDDGQVVEAPGVEPGSGKAQLEASTCVVDVLIPGGTPIDRLPCRVSDLCLAAFRVRRSVGGQLAEVGALGS